MNPAAGQEFLYWVEGLGGPLIKFWIVAIYYLSLVSLNVTPLGIGPSSPGAGYACILL